MKFRHAGTGFYITVHEGETPQQSMDRLLNHQKGADHPPKQLLLDQIRLAGAIQALGSTTDPSQVALHVMKALTVIARSSHNMIEVV